MSTNGIVAAPYGDSWRGRHVNWDGYPSWLGKQLQTIVLSDGVDKAVEGLIDAVQEWSSVDSNCKADGDRDISVEGYGKYYEDQQDHFYTPADSGGTWVYVLGESVMEILYNGESRSVPYADIVDWSKVEAWFR